MIYYDFSSIGSLLSDLKYRLQVIFIDVRVVFAPRGCNKSAHELAVLGNGVAHGELSLWTSSYPVYVTRLVTGDSADS
jgi:hypothetical protein